MNWKNVRNFLMALFLEPDDPLRRDQRTRMDATDLKIAQAQESLRDAASKLTEERESANRQVESIQAMVKGLRGAPPKTASRAPRTPQTKKAQKG